MSRQKRSQLGQPLLDNPDATRCDLSVLVSWAVLPVARVESQIVQVDSVWTPAQNSISLDVTVPPF